MTFNQPTRVGFCSCGGDVTTPRYCPTDAEPRLTCERCGRDHTSRKRPTRAAKVLAMAGLIWLADLFGV